MPETWETPTEMLPPKPEWLTLEIQRALMARHLPLTNDGMLMLWQKSKEDLEFFKAFEMDCRKICTGFLVPEKTEGTNNVELGNGYVAKAVIKYNYKLDSDNKKIWSCLDKIAAIGNQGKFIAERLVSWTPNFLKTEYTTLKEEADGGSLEAKDILKIIEDDMLTITEAAPELTIKEPKAKKK